MSKPLTEEELKIFEIELLHGPDNATGYVLLRAATEIRELRAENAKLREYVKHKVLCDKARYMRRDCTCGLDDALKVPAELAGPRCCHCGGVSPCSDNHIGSTEATAEPARGNLMGVDVDKVSVVNVQPGDVIALMHPQRLTRKSHEALMRCLGRLFPDNPSAILEEGMTMDLYRPALARELINAKG